MKDKGIKEKKSGRRTLYQRLHMIPFGKGLLIGLLLVVLSVPVGNWQALNSRLAAAQRVWDGLEVDNKRIPQDRQVPIAQLIKGCADAASNLITLMNHYPSVAIQEREALERARDAMRTASGPVSTAQADHDLFVSFEAAMGALQDQTGIADESERFELLGEVVASFNTQRRQLVIRTRDYDRQMQRALDTYNELPTRQLFPRPELYDDIATALKEGTT
ncbi:MAG: hypothetical protein FWD25_01995 [Clostridia bacterium]|nr:hypothetical protein [Clostridia bacterium]